MRCKVCHRRLTDPVSVQAGIGPVCRKRVGVLAKVEAECKVPGLRADLARPGRRWRADRFQTELNFDEETIDG